MKGGKLLRLSIWVISLLVVTMLTLPACSSQPTTAPSTTVTKTYKLRLQASPTNSSLHVFDIKQGDLLSTIPGVQVAVLAGGGMELGMNNLVKGDVELAMGGPEYLYRATKGILDQKEAWAKDVRVLWAYSSSPFTFFVIKDSGVTSLAQLTGKRYGLGIGSESGYLGGLVIELAGAKPDYLRTNSAAVEEALLNRQCMGYNQPGAPNALAKRIEASMPITILPVPQEVLDKAVEKYGARMFVPGVVPAGTYKGQDKDIPTIQNMLCFATTKDALDADIVYKMAKVMYDNRMALSTCTDRVEIMADWPQFTVKSSSTLLHAGVVRFLKNDLKLDVPSNLIPPEYK